MLPVPPGAEPPVVLLGDESTGFRAGQPQQLLGRESEDVAGRARFQPDRREGQQGPVDQHPGALEREPARCGGPKVAATAASRESLRIERALRGEQGDEGAPVALESRRVGGRTGRIVDAGRKFLEPSQRVRLPQERRDPLDGLGPSHSSTMKRASSNSVCSCSTSSGGAGVSIESAISA